MFTILFLHELEHEDIFKNNVGWFLLKRFLDLVRYLLLVEIISTRFY